MNSQQLRSRNDASVEVVRVVGAGSVVDLGSSGGRLRVLAGRVWITSTGVAEDHVLERGGSLRLPKGRTLVETWGPNGSALIAWRAGTLRERIAAALRLGGRRCWELMNPRARRRARLDRGDRRARRRCDPVRPGGRHACARPRRPVRRRPGPAESCRHGGRFRRETRRWRPDPTAIAIACARSSSRRARRCLTGSSAPSRCRASCASGWCGAARPRSAPTGRSRASSIRCRRSTAGAKAPATAPPRRIGLPVADRDDAVAALSRLVPGLRDRARRLRHPQAQGHRRAAAAAAGRALPGLRPGRRAPGLRRRLLRAHPGARSSRVRPRSASASRTASCRSCAPRPATCRSMPLLTEDGVMFERG